MRIGVAELPLHYGSAPRWLVGRMKKLSKEIVTILIDEYGRNEFLTRISNPYWFQAFGCVLGYDWHSSGVTTVVTGVLKTVLKPEEFGIAVCGGKGKTSRQTPNEIGVAGDKFNLSTDKISKLQYTSRMSAKVDNAAIQANYPLYHHVFIVTEDGKWAVVQQGMSIRDKTARRYHWLSDQVNSFVVEPHTGIVGDRRREIVLDMTAKESEDCRRTSTDLAKEKPERINRMLNSIRPKYQKSLLEWLPKIKEKEYVTEYLALPNELNWKALRMVYEFKPTNYEQLLGLKGVGPTTVRGLALVSDIIYGDRPSWIDPVKYSFAFGGKDGVPFPVQRREYDEAIKVIETAIQQAKLGNVERIEALKRLRSYAPPSHIV